MTSRRLVLTAALAAILPSFAAWEATRFISISNLGVADAAETPKSVTGAAKASGSLTTKSSPQASPDAKSSPATNTAKPTTSPSKATDKPQGKGEEKKKEEASKFLRVVRNKKGEATSLETSIVRYVPATGEESFTIDLVGAVHIGDKSYYRDLNKKMEQYDVLLYELVAPKGTRVPRMATRGGSQGPGMIKSMLELESQVDRIDYTRKNFVHADLSPKDMAEKMKERGDNAWSVTFSVIGDMMRQANVQAARRAKSGKPAAEVNILALLFADNSAIKLKRTLAEELEYGADPQALGNTLNVMLIKDRNEAAMKVLKQELAKGHKKIGIFYGSAHMPDFEARLMKEHKLKVKSVEWLTAWDLDE